MSATYLGESGAKEHLLKFYSKKEHIRKESSFIKHLENIHGGRSQDKPFSDYFHIEIWESYIKAFNKCVEEGTYIASRLLSSWPLGKIWTDSPL